MGHFKIRRGVKSIFQLVSFKKGEYRHVQLMGENMRILGKEIKN